MKFRMIVCLMMVITTAKSQFSTDKYPVYEPGDLGLQYQPTASVLKVWAPTASKMVFRLYKMGVGGSAVKEINGIKDQWGVYTAFAEGNWEGYFYSVQVQHEKGWSEEVPDPYVKLVGVNGKRGFIGDLKRTNPEAWELDKGVSLKYKTDAIVYELHVRDASIDPSSGIKRKGKYLGLTELNTVNKQGYSTGLSHIKELGVSHIHLLPTYDYFTVDESKPESKQYNWGYDPLNYNATEGSYATKADDGYTRAKEFKQLIQAFHKQKLNVVLDAVYNHTMFLKESSFEQLVPGYYYRQNADGSFSNATACGNEIASERPMVRKFIIESALYWLKEYHVDGFRFDLMGVLDIETMNLLSQELHKINPSVLMYGEGWTAGASPIPDRARALKKNVASLQNIAVFSDDIRDGIKGSVFELKDGGFASGKPGMEESIKFGIVASTFHPQVDYTKVNYAKAPYAVEPYQTITYCECHDNNVLWDKLQLSRPDATVSDRMNMHRLALGIVLTSQGISFLHAGTEFLRTKKGVENSFNSGDSINAIDWNLKSIHKSTFDFVSGLVKMRKAHPAFRMHTAAQIQKNIQFLTTEAGIVAYTIQGKAVGDTWKKVLVVFNGSNSNKVLSMPKGTWFVKIRENEIKRKTLQTKSSLELAPHSMYLFYQE